MDGQRKPDYPLTWSWFNANFYTDVVFVIESGDFPIPLEDAPIWRGYLTSN